MSSVCFVNLDHMLEGIGGAEPVERHLTACGQQLRVERRTGIMGRQEAVVVPTFSPERHLITCEYCKLALSDEAAPSKLDTK